MISNHQLARVFDETVKHNSSSVDNPLPVFRVFLFCLLHWNCFLKRSGKHVEVFLQQPAPSSSGPPLVPNCRDDEGGRRCPRIRARSELEMKILSLSFHNTLSFLRLARDNVKWRDEGNYSKEYSVELVLLMKR